MTFRGSSLIQKAYLNSLSDDIECDISESGTAQASTINLNPLQLTPEQALQFGLKILENGNENFPSTLPQPQQNSIFNTSQAASNNVIDATSNLQKKAAKSNIASFILKSGENNSSLLNRTAQIKSKLNNDVISELLSFNNDEEGSLFVQNNSLNKIDTESKKISTTKASPAISYSDVNKPLKYTINSNMIKPMTLLSKPIRPNVVNANKKIALSSQSLLKNNIVNRKTGEGQVLKTINTKSRPILIKPIKGQINMRSLLVNSNAALKANTNNQSVVASVLNNQPQESSTEKQSVVKQNQIKNPVQIIRVNNPQNGNMNPFNYKIEYRLDLANDGAANNNTAKDTFTVNMANPETPADNSSTLNKNVPIDFNLLNKAVSSHSKVEDSIVPLNKNKSEVDLDTKMIQKGLHRFTVNTNKPLGSTENPIKLLQKGQAFQSLQSLNEGELQQIVGALKQRPPPQECGDREPHKVVLYDTETHTRFIYRIVYPDELNLKPSNDAEEDASKEIKEKRKRKTKLREEPTMVQDCQQLPRTRTGRVIRPPNRMLHDFKKLRRTCDDSDKDEWVDAEEIQESVLKSNILVNNEHTNGIGLPAENILQNIETAINNEASTQITNSGLESQNLNDSTLNNNILELPRRTKNINSKFRCPTCNKIYLGYAKMSKHLDMYPDHGDINELGLEPKPLQKPKMRRRHGNKLAQSKLKSNISKSINNKSTIEPEKCEKTLFECFIEKVINQSGGITKWQAINNELKNFIYDLEHFVKEEVLQSASNDSEEQDETAPNMVFVDSTISRLMRLKPGNYQLRELFNSSSQESGSDISLPEQTKTSSPNTINKLLENTITSIQENKANLSNSSIDLDMLCSTEPVFEKNGILDRTSEPTTLQQHMDMLIENEQNMPQADHISDSNITLNSSRNSALEGIATNLNNISYQNRIVAYQNVDDLVQESLQNLGAHEITADPVAHSTLQDLSLDLFQFHHS